MNDEPILIHSYSRREAIADGVLIDVSDTSREAGFQYPVAITATAWARCVEVPAAVPWQDEAGRLWDVLTMLGHAVRRSSYPNDRVQFDVLVQNDRDGTTPIRLYAVCGPDDDLSPCLTIMLPGED